MNSKIFMFIVVLLLFAVSCQQDSDPQAKTLRQLSIEDSLKKGEFRLMIDSSVIKIKTVKNGNIPVMGTLNLNAGLLHLNPGDPLFDLSIDMESWHSGLTLRDTRVVQTFFESNLDPHKFAVFKVRDLDKKLIETLQSTQILEDLPVQGVLTYNKTELPVAAKLKVFFGKNKRLTIETLEPFENKISELGLSDNLKKLLIICNHKSIDDVVKVDIHLEFDGY